MQLSDFDYDLPPEYIAQTPAEPRDSSKLLVYERDSQKVQHKIFNQLPELLRAGDVLVINDTKVIPARLKTTEGHEVFLVRDLKRDSSTSYAAADFAQNDKVIWECLVRGGKHFEVGAEFTIAADFTGRVLKILESGERVIEFTTSNFDAALEKYGATPLPPYIHQTEKKVPEYQTVYADKKGSVAAPTAGLHFTDELFTMLRAKGVQIEKLTLHVGLGTFLPVKTERIEDHPMHAEFFTLDSKVVKRLNQAKSESRRIIAVGSTSCRVLESCTDSAGVLKAQSGETDIFIYPGYEFRFLDGMLTNFHLPKSTLIMLVAAFIGRGQTFELYEIAKEKGYRFYSFGDAMLLL